MSNLVVGAYPASPAHRVWNPNLEARFFEALSMDRRIGSLELPWSGSIHPHDDDWLKSNFPSDFQAIITSIPFVMVQISKNPKYGLASNDPEGRNQAIEDVKKILKAADDLNQYAGRKVVSHLELHSAPRVNGTPSDLAASLTTLFEFEPDGPGILLEHCDAFIEAQIPEKGFLSLEDEIKAIEIAGIDAGILINWGRSAIEFRNPDRVTEHIEIACSKRLLKGLIFSGASDKETTFGPAWIDAHNPFRKSEKHKYGESDSLLTPERAHLAIRKAGSINLLGIKMGWVPSLEGTPNERVSMISSALDELDYGLLNR